jgi:hypothetical protein
VKQLPWVILWAIAFAYVESAVVEYLRALYYPLAQGGFRFPVITVEQLEAMGPEHWRRLFIELGRELCTLIMLGAVGAAVGKNRREAWAHFMIAFGVWDIFFYLWLKIFIDWPQGLLTWDLLFLVPVPWVAPVLAPILISVALIASGVKVLSYEGRGSPLVVSWAEWMVISAGGLTVIVSFCLDYENIMNGGFPNPFHWGIYLFGFCLSCATFIRLLFKHRNVQV